jgi:hypothetical protein
MASSIVLVSLFSLVYVTGSAEDEPTGVGGGAFVSFRRLIHLLSTSRSWASTK